MAMDWVAVYVTTDEFQAELIKAILCDNEVDAVIMNQKDSSYTTFGEVRVMVNEANLERAENIIKSL